MRPRLRAQTEEHDHIEVHSSVVRSARATWLCRSCREPRQSDSALATFCLVLTLRTLTPPQFHLLAEGDGLRGARAGLSDRTTLFIGESTSDYDRTMMSDTTSLPSVLKKQV